MLDASASARPESPAVSRAERIARIAMSPAAQAVVDQAPPFSRAQIDIVRAACADATARFHEREAIPVPPGDGCPCGHTSDEECIRHQPVRAEADWTRYGTPGHLHATGCSRAVCGRVA